MTIHGRTVRDVRMKIKALGSSGLRLYEMSKRHLNIRAHKNTSTRINIQISVSESVPRTKMKLASVFIIHFLSGMKAVKYTNWES